MKLKFIGAAIAAFAMSACASNTAEDTTAPVSPPPAAVNPGPTPGTNAHLQAEAGDSVFFAFDSHALTSEARTTLDRQAAWLQTYRNARIRVEGNCDERGTREYNIALGERRASAARDYLVTRGVDPSRITVVSYGKERPRDPRSNEAAWAVNRNAQTVVTNAVGS